MQKSVQRTEFMPVVISFPNKIFI